MLVRDLFVTFKENTVFELWVKNHDMVSSCIFSDSLNYAESWMLDLYVSKARVNSEGVIVCYCEE